MKALKLIALTGSVAVFVIGALMSIPILFFHPQLALAIRERGEDLIRRAEELSDKP